MSGKKTYQICTNCVLDTTDPDITFDDKGICNYCHTYWNVTSKQWLRGEQGKAATKKIVDEIKAYGKGKEYDCIIGLSGGIDSSYLAYLGKEWGLRMLAVHVDAGWNSELAVKNIENICKQLNIDLITEVIDWSVMRKVQLAFLKSGLVNQDIPQDHAFFAALYRYAEKNNIKYVLNGYNISTENTLPLAWRGQAALDDVLVKSVYKRYMKEPLKGFPLINFWKYGVWNKITKKFVVVDLLNNVEYDKNEALKLLIEKLEFNDYGGKHNESRFTKFHQNYFLVEKYGFEKRKAHLSSLILSEAMTREEALEELKKPIYATENDRNDDIEYVAKKLRVNIDEFMEIIESKPALPEDFSSSQSKQKYVDPIIRFAIKLRNKLRSLIN